MSYTLTLHHLFQCDRCNVVVPYVEQLNKPVPSGNRTVDLSFNLTLDSKFLQKKDLLLCGDCTQLFYEFMGF